GHKNGVACTGNGRVHENAVAAQFHGNGGIGSGAHAGIHKHGDIRLVDDETQVPGIKDAHAGADQRCQRHDGHAANVFEHASLNRVVGAINHDLEAIVDQRFGGFQGFGHIGEQIVLVTQYFQFDQVVPVEQFTCQA